MADDMASNVERNAYQDAFQAQIGERVTSLGRRQSDLEGEMRSGFKQMELSISGIANEMRTAIAGLSSNMAERSRPQWQALGVALTFAALLGGLAYMPIREATGDLKSGVMTLSEKMVTQQEMQWRTQRGIEDRQRMEQAIASIREEQVPRKEHDRVWLSYDKQLEDMQRQMNEAKAQLSSIYNARDVIMDLRDRVDRVERNKLGTP